MKFNPEQISILEGYGIRILSQDCPWIESQDKSLPNSYIITCKRGEDVWYDIVISNKKADIFDAYYDLFGDVVRNITWTEGRINPRVWQDPRDTQKKQKK